jgi:hypothetical protein
MYISLLSNRGNDQTKTESGNKGNTDTPKGNKITIPVGALTSNNKNN